MRYFCLACDYDGTLAHHGQVHESTVAALESLRASGRTLILVTGRTVHDLRSVFSRLDLFSRVVAENGAVLYQPATQEEKCLTEPPPASFVQELRRRGVTPLSVGRSIVATWMPWESAVLDVIREQGLGWQVIFNKGAVMALPSGVNKSTGLAAALRVLGLSPQNTVSLGDAENDHALLEACLCGVAVANAVPLLKERADFVTSRENGAGVQEIIDKLLEDDLDRLSSRITRHNLLLGWAASGERVELESFGLRALVAGSSGSGKSSTVAALVERMIDHRFQICVFDPEGDYDNFSICLTLGTPDRAAAETEILDALAHHPGRPVTINLLAIPEARRAAYSARILAALMNLRSRTGRPHFFIFDEAHQLLPLESLFAARLEDFLLVSAYPDRISPFLLQSLNTFLLVGSDAATVARLPGVMSSRFKLPPSAGAPNRSGRVLAWLPSRSDSPIEVSVKPASVVLRRHRRLYAAGELGADKSFYFRGPHATLKLRAQNLKMFVLLGEGVDDATWGYHLAQHDYSRWFRDSVKDEDVAAEIEQAESDQTLDAAESRAEIFAILRKHYTAAE